MNRTQQNLGETLRNASCVCILGRMGSGKTTIARKLAIAPKPIELDLRRTSDDDAIAILTRIFDAQTRIFDVQSSLGSSKIQCADQSIILEITRTPGDELVRVITKLAGSSRKLKIQLILTTYTIQESRLKASNSLRNNLFIFLELFPNSDTNGNVVASRECAITFQGGRHRTSLEDLGLLSAE